MQPHNDIIYLFIWNQENTFFIIKRSQEIMVVKSWYDNSNVKLHWTKKTKTTSESSSFNDFFFLAKHIFPLYETAKGQCHGWAFRPGFLSHFTLLLFSLSLHSFFVQLNHSHIFNRMHEKRGRRLFSLDERPSLIPTVSGILSIECSSFFNYVCINVFLANVPSDTYGGTAVVPNRN